MKDTDQDYEIYAKCASECYQHMLQISTSLLSPFYFFQNFYKLHFREKNFAIQKSTKVEAMWKHEGYWLRLWNLCLMCIWMLSTHATNFNFLMQSLQFFQNFYELHFSAFSEVIFDIVTLVRIITIYNATLLNSFECSFILKMSVK